MCCASLLETVTEKLAETRAAMRHIPNFLYAPYFRTGPGERASRTYKRECQERTAPLRLNDDFFLGIQPKRWNVFRRAQALVCLCVRSGEVVLPSCGSISLL